MLGDVYKRQNTDGYVDQYVAHHVTLFDGLTRDHVTKSTSVFICGLQLYNHQHVHEHCRQVHGLPQGISTLKPMQPISVDKDTAFTCPDLKTVEEVGTEEKAMQIEAVYNMGVTKGVFQTLTNNKSTADLRRTRAQEFLRELKKACQSNFYGRFLCYSDEI